MSTQNYPHINDDVLKALDDGNLIYLDKNDENACSFVVRLAPTVVNGKSLPLRFEKRAKPNHDGMLDTQVINEGDIFNRMQAIGVNIDKIVNRLKYSQEANGDYILVTESVGLDADKWQSIPLYFNGRSYKNIFCHPLVFLHFIKGTLLGLKSIHQHQLYHCDIRSDQICIPFTKNQNNIIINPDDIKLIDFGIAIYQMHPIITHNPVRFNSKNMPEGDYVATSLIKAGDFQCHLYHTEQSYNFDELLNQIDCAVDLYSFGFLLNSFEIEKLALDVKLWNSFENEYQVWVKELLALSNKKTPFKNNLPHDNYLHQVNEWIQNVQQESGLTIDKLVFEIENTNPISYQPTNTPTPPREDRDIDINIDNTSSYKEFNEYGNINIKNDNAESNLNAISGVQQPNTTKSNRLFGRIIIIGIIIAVLATSSYVFFTKNNHQPMPTPEPNPLPNPEPETITEPTPSPEPVDDKQSNNPTLPNSDEPLFSMIKGDKVGYVNKAGQVIIDFEFDGTLDFNEGFASVKKNDKWGYIDKTGQMVTDFEFDLALDFNKGFAIVQKNGKWGYIDKTGKMVTDFEFDDTRFFHEGLAFVNKNGKWGYIDKTGQMVTDFEFDDTGAFDEGLAFVNKNGKWGYIDKTGQMVTDFEFDGAYSFSNGLAPVQKHNKWGYIDKAGKMVIDFEFDGASIFFDGLAHIKKNEKWGYIDTTGKMVTDFEFDSVANFSDRLAPVQKNGKWGYIDTTGKMVTDFEFDSVANFSDGLAFVGKNGKVGYINKTGKMVTDFEFDETFGFNEDFARVKKNGKWGYIDKTGQMVTDFEFDGANGFNNGLALVLKNGKWGYIDKTGQMVISEADY